MYEKADEAHEAHRPDPPPMTDEEFLRLFEYLRFGLKFNIWVKVKSDRQRELLEYMFHECVFDCEFNADKSEIRRVELTRYYNAEHNKHFTERTRPSQAREQDVA